MELLENKYCWSHRMETVISHMALDEEILVPEDKPEAGRILLKRGEAVLDPVVPVGERMVLKGKVEYWIWYEDAEGKSAGISGQIPFEMEPEGKWAGVSSEVHLELEDFSVLSVQSRRIRINGVLEAVIFRENREEKNVCCQVRGIDGVQEKMISLNGMMFLGEKTDTIRIRQNLEIPASVDNLEELLFFQAALRNPDIQPEDGKVRVQGDLDLFAVYRCEGEEGRVGSLHRMLPFQGEMSVPLCRRDGMFRAVPKLIHKEMVIGQDEDGENRVLSLDVVLEVAVTIQEEQSVSLLEDAYSPEREVEVTTEAIRIPGLCVRNQARMKLTDTVAVPGMGRVLQTFCSDGWVKLEEVKRVPEGLALEGVLLYWGVYLAEEKGERFASFSGAAPFSFVIDLGKKEEECRFEVRPRVDQMTLSIIGNQEIECRAAISFDTIAWKELEKQVVVQVQDRPLSKEKREGIPGVVGYIVQPQDSLWSIAKKYRSTEALICEKNGITGEVRPGDRLVLLRSTGGILK